MVQESSETQVAMDASDIAGAGGSRKWISRPRAGFRHVGDCCRECRDCVHARRGHELRHCGSARQNQHWRYANRFAKYPL